jgi:hypothetical protein
MQIVRFINVLLAHLGNRFFLSSERQNKTGLSLVLGPFLYNQKILLRKLACIKQKKDLQWRSLKVIAILARILERKDFHKRFQKQFLRQHACTEDPKYLLCDLGFALRLPWSPQRIYCRKCFLQPSVP